MTGTLGSHCGDGHGIGCFDSNPLVNAGMNALVSKENGCALPAAAAAAVIAEFSATGVNFPIPLKAVDFATPLDDVLIMVRSLEAAVAAAVLLFAPGATDCFCTAYVDGCLLNPTLLLLINDEFWLRLVLLLAPNWENPRIIVPGCSFGPFQGKLDFPCPPTSGALVSGCPVGTFLFALAALEVVLAGFLDEDFLLAFFFAIISSMLTTLLNRVASLVGFPPSFLAWVELFTVISSKR